MKSLDQMQDSTNELNEVISEFKKISHLANLLAFNVEMKAIKTGDSENELTEFSREMRKISDETLASVNKLEALSKKIEEHDGSEALSPTGELE